MPLPYRNLVMPRWASDDGSAVIVEPSSADKDVGWISFTGKKRMDWENWLKRRSYDYHKLLRDILWFGYLDSFYPRASAAGASPSTVARVYASQSAIPENPAQRIVAVGDDGANGGVILESTNNGESWTQRLNHASGLLRSVAYNGSNAFAERYCAVGGVDIANATVFTGNGATTWNDQSAAWAGPDAPYLMVRELNNLYIVITSGGESYSSVTGVTPVLRDSSGSGYVSMDVNTSTLRQINLGITTSRTSNNIVTFSTLVFGVANFNIGANSVIKYSNDAGLHTWVVSGYFTGGVGRRTGFIYSIDDGSTWNPIDPDGTLYPFYGATGNNPSGTMIAYNPIAKHWVVGEREESVAKTSRFWSGRLEDPDSWELRALDLPSVAKGSTDEVAQTMEWVQTPNLDERSQFFLFGIEAASSNAILKGSALSI